MTAPSLGYPKRAAVGLIVALAIGLAVVATCNTVWALVGDFPIKTLWNDVSPSQVLLASFPYLVLGVCGIRSLRPWITGLFLTAIFWGYYLWDITHYEGGGANIGVGILMMFSPIPITMGSFLALASLGGRRKTEGVAACR